MLQRAKGVSAGKRRASPALRVTSVHVLRPRKSNSHVNQRLAWARVLRTPAHVVFVRAAARRARFGQAVAVARGLVLAASASASPRAWRLVVRGAGRLNRCAVQAEPASGPGWCRPPGPQRGGVRRGARCCRRTLAPCSAGQGQALRVALRASLDPPARGAVGNAPTATTPVAGVPESIHEIPHHTAAA